MAPNLLGDPYHLHHLFNGMHAYDVRTREYRRGHGGSCPPVALDRRTSSKGLAEKGLPRGSDENRKVEGGCQFRKTSQHTITVGGLLGKSYSWIDDKSFP